MPGCTPRPLRYAIERRRAEEALRESEERFRVIFEQAAVGMAQVGLDGRWLRVNQKLCEIVGYTRAELDGLTFQEITHPEDLEVDLVQARRLAAGEIQTHAMEKRYLRKDGSTVWVNQTGSVLRDPAGLPRNYVAVVEDITERKQVEAERNRLLAELDATIASIPSGVVIFGSNAEVIGMNAAASRMTGLAQEQCGLSLEERLRLLRLENPDGSPLSPEESLVLRALAGETIDGFVRVLQPLSGRPLWITVGAAPIRAADDRLLGAVLSFTDVTASPEVKAMDLASGGPGAVVKRLVGEIDSDWAVT